MPRRRSKPLWRCFRRQALGRGEKLFFTGKKVFPLSRTLSPFQKKRSMFCSRWSRRNQKLPLACRAASPTTGAQPAAQGAISRRYSRVLSRRRRGRGLVSSTEPTFADKARESKRDRSAFSQARRQAQMPATLFRQPRCSNRRDDRAMITRKRQAT